MDREKAVKIDKDELPPVILGEYLEELVGEVQGLISVARSIVYSLQDYKKRIIATGNMVFMAMGVHYPTHSKSGYTPDGHLIKMSERVDKLETIAMNARQQLLDTINVTNFVLVNRGEEPLSDKEYDEVRDVQALHVGATLLRA